MRAKKVLAGVLGIAIVVVVAFWLAGCGVAPDDAVKQAVSDEVAAMKSVTSMDSETVKQYFGEEDATFAGIGISAAYVVKAFFTHCTYDVTNVEVSEDGTSAVAFGRRDQR